MIIPIYRKPLEENGELGLKKLMSKNYEVSLFIKLVHVIAFDKQGEIKKSIDGIVEEVTNVAEPQFNDRFVIKKLDELCLCLQ